MASATEKREETRIPAATKERSGVPKKTSHKKIVQFIPWIAIAVLAFCILIPSFLKQDFIEHYGHNLELLNEPVSMLSFPAGALVREQLFQNDEVHIWIENNPSMAGFIAFEKVGCPESFFEYLVKNTGKITSVFGKGVKRKLFSFDRAFANQMSVQGTQASFSPLAVQAVSDFNFFLKEESYASLPKDTGLGWEKEKTNSSVAAALAALDLSQPNLILTDFLEPEGALASSQLQAACERIFEQNLSIAIVGMDSFFGGKIYDAANGNKIYSFGRSKEDKDIPKLSTYYSNHRHPRPFYAIIVGSATQCEDLVEHLMDLYQTHNASLKYEGVETKDIHKITKANEFVCRKAEYIYLGRNGVLQNLFLVDQDTIHSQVQSSDVQYTRTVDERAFDGRNAHAEGVDAFRIVKRAEDMDSQLFTVCYSLQPKVEGYEQSWNMDAYRIEPEVRRVLVFEPISEEDAKQNQNSVHIIGSYYLAYELVPFLENAEAIKATDLVVNAKGLSFSLEVNVSQLERGFYQVQIPVSLTRNKELSLEDLDQTWVVDWSIARKEFTKSNPQAVYCTTELQDHIYDIIQAQVKCIEKSTQVASITVDLEVAKQ